MTRTASLADLAGAIDAGPLAGFRNAIINGNFDIWQRGTSFSNPGTGAYTADRWMPTYNGTGATRTLSRQAFTLGQTDVPGEPTYFFRFAQSVAGSGGTFNTINQRMEGVRTFAGQQVTLSFWAKASASLTLTNIALQQYFGAGGSPSSTVSSIIVASPVIGTSWTKYSYTFTVPSISGKTLGSDNNDFMEVFWNFPANTTFTFDIAQVQLEAGPVATPFERRSIGTELALCQRYYERYDTAQIGRVNIATCANMGSTTTTGPFTWVVTKRAVPTITVSGDWRTLGQNQGAAVTLTFGEINVYRAQATGTGSGYTQGNANMIQGSDSANAIVEISAEL